MKVMVIVKATKASEAGEMPSTELLTEMGEFNEKLVKAGVLVDAAGLTPSSRGARVRFSGTNRTVLNGPFAETKELIAGFWIWQVKSLEDAIEWVKQCPNPMLEDSDIEIRPFFGVEDFGEALTPDLREKEAALRACGLGLNEPTFQVGSQLLIAGISRRYTRESRVEIPRQWEEFNTQMKSIPDAIDDDSYGISSNQSADCGFDYLTGIAVSSVTRLPKGMTSIKLEASRYAVFVHTGHISAFSKTIDLIWSKWAPDCGLKIAKTPCFERYTPKFNPQTGMGGTEIWIPLREA